MNRRLSQYDRSPLRVLNVALVGAALSVTGCQALNQQAGATRSLFSGDAARAVAQKEPIDGEIQQASAEQSVAETARLSTVSLANYLTGKEPLNNERAKDLYRQADAQFRKAADLPKPEGKKEFAAAAKLFEGASEAAPGTAIEQEALFMLGESLFFADYLPDADEAYARLQKNYPRNQYSDQVGARRFEISRYWIETEKAGSNSWLPLNLTDSSRPAMDADGHAIRVLDQIRFDDPTGRLADDATMAGAMEYLRQGKIQEADGFFTDLRDAYPDSDHLFMAHMLGIRCKLQIYQGPDYSNLMLEEADKLVRQTRQRFPDRLAEEKYADMIARAAAEIDYHRAEHLYKRGRFNEKGKSYRAARGYYQTILDGYGSTPFAELARERLSETEGRPPVPKRHLQWLTRIFPDTKRRTPLVATLPTEASEDATIRR